MKCTKCGAENLDGASRCMDCGASLGDKQAGRAASPLPDATSATGPSRSTVAIWAVVVVAAVILIGVFMAAGSGGGGGGGGLTSATATPTPSGQVARISRREMESQVASDVALVQARDYARTYSLLAAADQASVTQSEWVARQKEAEEAVGVVQSYKVVSVNTIDASETLVAVAIQVKVSKLAKPIPAELYYDLQNGHPVQTMLWGREFVSATNEVK